MELRKGESMSSRIDSPESGWMAEHPEDQQYLPISAEVDSILTGCKSGADRAYPMFRELSLEEEQEFRTHARENYVVGSPIYEINHPVWKDEARKMNEEK